MNFRVHPLAEDEFIAAIDHYEEAGGLGLEFVDAIESAYRQIVQTPRGFPLHPASTPDQETRRFVMRRFPFSIAYVIDPNEIVILAIAHAKRRPDYWLRRRAN